MHAIIGQVFFPIPTLLSHINDPDLKFLLSNRFENEVLKYGCLCKRSVLKLHWLEFESEKDYAGPVFYADWFMYAYSLVG